MYSSFLLCSFYFVSLTSLVPEGDENA